MKVYRVKVKDDAVEQEYMIERAKEALRKRKTAIAAFYAYCDNDGKMVFFNEPLVKYSDAEVKELVNGLRNGKKGTDKVVYGIFREHLDDED